MNSVAESDESAVVDPSTSDDAVSGASAPDKSVSVGAFFGDTLIYGLAKVIDPAIGFALLPLLTLLLGPADYGVVSLYNATLQLAFVLFSLGVHQAFLRFYTEAADSDERRAVLNSSLRAAVVAWVVLTPLLVVLAPTLGQALFGSPDSPLVYVLMASSLVLVIDAIGCNLLQAEGRAWSYFFYYTAGAVVVRGLATVLVFLGMGAAGWIAGEALGRLTTVAALLLLAFRGASLWKHTGLTKQVVSYGVMLVPAMVSFYVMAVTDKYLIRLLADNPFDRVGMYTVGERIAGIMHLVNLAFMLGWQRFAFRNIHQVGGDKAIATGLLLYVTVAGWLAMVLMSLGDDLTRLLVPESFSEGIVVIAPLTLAALAAGLAGLAEIGLHKVRKPHYISGISSAVALVNIGCNFYAIPRYGIAGAAWATFLCQAVRLGFMWSVSQRCFNLPFEYGRAAVAVVVLALAWAAGWFAESQTAVPPVLVQLAMPLVAAWALWVAGVVNPEEKRAISRSIRNRLKRFGR